MYRTNSNQSSPNLGLVSAKPFIHSSISALIFLRRIPFFFSLEGTNKRTTATTKATTMGSSKKYKLFSKSASAGNGKPICAFFQSPEGCRNGDKCQFLHIKEGETPPAVCEVVPDTTSMISSESEGEENIQQETAPKTNGKNEMPRKKKKRKANNNNDEDDDIGDLFANPLQRKSSTPTTPKTKVENTPPQKKQKTNKSATMDTPKAKAKTPTRSGGVVSDFRSFVNSLPVASFVVGGEGKAVPQTPSVGTPARETAKSPGKHDHVLLPNHTEVGRKWQKAIVESRKHPRYDSSFDFTKYKEIEEKAGIQTNWIKAKPFGPWCANNPQAIAIDCEMCETQDPLSGAKNHKALCRLSVVNAEKPEEVLLDTLVKPAWPVTDYRTRINGIDKENLENVSFTLRHAQAFMMALCSEETVIVGQAVQNDLAALNMEHQCNADSSFLFQAKDNAISSVSLKDLVKTLFHKDMPETHDSVNDARKALECVQYWVEKDGDVPAIERTFRNKGNQLFVHRIPKQCRPQHLEKMFLKNTSIAPTEVDDIEFLSETGKTHVSFKSVRHASLAFDTLEGIPEPDKSGRLQKKVYLRTGDYVRVRKMVKDYRDNKNSNNNSFGTPNNTPGTKSN